MALTSVVKTASQSVVKKQGSRFVEMTADDPYRLVCSVAGIEKSGKDHFGLTAPGPIGILSMDTGLEGVAKKFIKRGKRLYITEYQLEIQPGDAEPQKVAEAADKVWGRYVEDFRDSIRTYPTTICDTSTESWELLRLARFGKLGQVLPHHYGPVNREYIELHREVYDTANNLILLHKMKDEWVNKVVNGKEVGNKTGRKEIKCQSDMAFLVQANLQSWYDGNFHVTITDCRQNMELSGLTVDVDGWDRFNTVANLVYEGEWPYEAKT